MDKQAGLWMALGAIALVAAALAWIAVRRSWARYYDALGAGTLRGKLARDATALAIAGVVSALVTLLGTELIARYWPRSVAVEQRNPADATEAHIDHEQPGVQIGANAVQAAGELVEFRSVQGRALLESATQALRRLDVKSISIQLGGTWNRDGVYTTDAVKVPVKGDNVATQGGVAPPPGN
jgi:hypothetical protein